MIGFVIPIGNYHCKVMPFGLKNASATYQKVMIRMFKPQLGKNIEIYINDMIVKSKGESEHVNGLGNIFDILRKHKLQLNTSKCSFGVGSSKFLGYMVTHRGIEVNPDQIKAINNLQPPRNPKESEHVNGLGNIFDILRKHKLQLNTSKCSFGVGSGKFLGYMVTHRGIEVNPDQIKAINNL